MRRGDHAHAHGHGDGYGMHQAKSSRLPGSRNALHRHLHDRLVIAFVPDERIPQRCVDRETVLDARLARHGPTRIRRRHGTARGQPHHRRNDDDVNGRREPKCRYAARPRHHASCGERPHRRTVCRRADIHAPREIVRDADQHSGQYVCRGPSSLRRRGIVFEFPEIGVDLRPACSPLRSRQAVRVDPRPRANQPHREWQQLGSHAGTNRRRVRRAVRFAASFRAARAATSPAAVSV